MLKLLHSIAEIAPIPMLLIEGQGWCLYANPIWTQLTGIDRSSSLGLGWTQTLAANDRERILDHCTLNPGGTDSVPFETILQTANAEFVWVQVATQSAASISKGAQLWTFSDISNIIKVTKGLTKSRDEVRLLAEAIPQLVWSINDEGIVEYVNTPWVDYTGIDVYNFVKGTLRKIVHPNDYPETRQKWKEALSTGVPFEMEYRLRSRTDGSYKWFLGRATKMSDNLGNLKRWVGTATDIDDQKRSAEKLKFVLGASNVFSSTLEITDICEELAGLAVKHFADWCFINLDRKDSEANQYFYAHRQAHSHRKITDFYERQSIEDRTGFFGERDANFSSRLIQIASSEFLKKTARSNEHLEILQQLDLYSIIILPLETDEGGKLGSVTLISSESRRVFEQGDLDVAEMVARRAAVSIQHAQAYNAERQTSQNLRFIARASELLSDSFDVRRGLQGVLDLVVQEIADFAVVLRAENDGQLVCIALAHPDKAIEQNTRTLLNQRIYNAETELKLLTRLSLQASFITENMSDHSGGIHAALQHIIDDINVYTSLTIPLYSRGTTYGALIVCFTDISGRTYQDWNFPLFDDLGRRTSIAIENSHAYERERSIAEALQQSLLPMGLPKVQGIDFFAEYIPSSDEVDVGGDWYDALILDDGRILINIGDVIGRGAKAASIMGFIRQAISVVSMKEKDPARVLDLIDEIITQRHADAMATAFLAFIDPLHSVMRYANAGLHYPVIRIAQTLIELGESCGLPLGLRRQFGTPYDSTEISLKDVDLLAMYTNGLVESEQENGTAENDLYQILSTDAVLHVNHPAKFLRDACVQKVRKDDVAILMIRFTTRESWTFDAENSGTAHHSREEFVRYLDTQVANKTSIADAELVYGELVSNVVIHAPGPIDVQLDWLGLHAVLHVLDRGEGQIPSGPSLPDPLCETGRGLFIIQSMCSEISVERIPGYGNHISVVLPIQRARDATAP